MRNNFFLSLFFIICTLGVNGETSISNIDEILKLGIKNSPDYKKSLLLLEEAERGVSNIFNVDETSISVTSINQDLEVDNWRLNTSINIPLLNQVVLNGEIDNEQSGSIGVTFKPFNHSSDVIESNIILKSQEEFVKYTLLQVRVDSVSSVLEWVSAKRNYDVQLKKVELMEVLYSDNKSRYENTDLTLDELKDTLIELSESRKSLFEKQQILYKAEINLFSKLGVLANDIDINGFSITEIEKELGLIKSVTDLKSADYLKSYNYFKSYYDLELSKAKLDDSWWYTPNFTTKANLDFDSNQNYKASASLNFTLSLEDFSDFKDLMEEEYKILTSEFNAVTKEVELEFNQGLDTLKSSGINREICSIEYEQAKDVLLEAKILFDSGDYSEVEYEESRLYYVEAQNRLFESLVQEYISWMNIQEYL